MRRRHGGRERPAPERPPKRPKRKRPRFRLPGTVTWRVWLILAAVVLAGSYGTGYVLSTQVLFPVPETVGEEVAVPDLYGATRTDAESRLRTMGLVLGEIRELKSMTADSGRILAQDPLPGQQLLPGAAVSLGVSTGPPQVRIPPLVGLSEGTARELLEAAGFEVVVQQTRTMDFPAGVVTRAEPEPGTPQQLPAEVTLVISSGPPADSLPDTLGLGGIR